MPTTSFISMALTKVTTIWHFTVFTLYSHIITTTINKSRSFKTGLPKIHKRIKFIFTIFKLLQIFLKGFIRFLYQLHDPIQLQLLFFNLLQCFDALSRYSGPHNGETYCRIPEKTITRPLHAQLLTYCDSHFIKKDCPWFIKATNTIEIRTHIQERWYRPLSRSHHPEIQHHVLYKYAPLSCLYGFYTLEACQRVDTIKSPEDHSPHLFLCACGGHLG